MGPTPVDHATQHQHRQPRVKIVNHVNQIKMSQNSGPLGARLPSFKKARKDPLTVSVNHRNVTAGKPVRASEGKVESAREG